MKDNDLTHRRLAMVLLGSIVSLISVQPAHAVVSTWSSVPTDADWNNSANWSDSIPASDDSVTFGATSGATALNNNLTTGAAWVIPSITFSAAAPAYTVTGNSFTLGNGTTASTVIINASTATQTINNDIVLGNAVRTISAGANGGNVALKGSITGEGTLAKAGVGVLTISGNNLYTGATHVKEGTLVVSGSLSATSSVSGDEDSILSVESGLINGTASITSAGTVQGQGSVGALNITAGGNLAPGHITSDLDSLGTLTVNGDVSFGDNTTFTIRLGQNGASDKLAINGGSLTLNNVTLALDLTHYSGVVGDRFVIVSGGAGLTGGANIFAQGTTITANGQLFSIGYATNLSGTVGNDIVLEYLAVPEPATWGMVLTGFGMLVSAQRLRRNRAARQR